MVVNFNEFAQWYIGKKVSKKSIIKYFDNELGIDVEHYVDKDVTINEAFQNGMYIYTIGLDFEIDAMSSFFKN